MLPKKYATKENEPHKHVDEYTLLRKGESGVESYANAKEDIFSNSSSRSLPVNLASVPHRNEYPSLHSPETVHYEPSLSVSITISPEMTMKTLRSP